MLFEGVLGTKNRPSGKKGAFSGFNSIHFNIGIGTTGPGAKLDILGATSAGTIDSDLRLKNGNSTAGSGTAIELNGYYNAARLRGWTPNAGASTAGAFDIQVNNDSNLFTTALSINKAGDVTIAGTLTVNGTQTGATDHVFDDYDDMELLRKWREGEPLPFERGDMLNRDRLLRDTIIQLEKRVHELEEIVMQLASQK